MKKDRIAFLGCPLDMITPSEILEYSANALYGQGRVRIEGLNVAKLVEARSDPALMAALCDAELVHIDGAGISLGLTALDIMAPERRAGVDLMIDICQLAAASNRSVYLLGAKPEIVTATAQRLVDSVPGLRIAGFRDGYFVAAEEAEVVQGIRRSGADILFIGISSPKKERFLQMHWEDLGVSVGMGVGGSFDVTSGALRRAPQWVQRYGLEWLFRLKQEPRRLFKRYAFTNLCFLWLLIQARLHINQGLLLDVDHLIRTYRSAAFLPMVSGKCKPFHAWGGRLNIRLCAFGDKAVQRRRWLVWRVRIAEKMRK